ALMTKAEDFLNAILANPDDDGLRMVFADWLEERGDPRGEFIRVQCELERMQPDDPRRPPLFARELALIRDNKDSWIGPFCRELFHWDFRRGFLQEIICTLEAFLRLADEIFRSQPVQDVTLRGAVDDVADFRKLEECLHLSRLRSLYLSGNLTVQMAKVLAA